MATREIIKALSDDWGLCLFYAAYNALDAEERRRFVGDSPAGSLHAGFWQTADPNHNAETGYTMKDMQQYLDSLRRQGWIRRYRWKPLPVKDKARDRTCQGADPQDCEGPVTMSTIIRGNRFPAGTVLIISCHAITAHMRGKMCRRLSDVGKACKRRRLSSSEAERCQLRAFQSKCHSQLYQKDLPPAGCDDVSDEKWPQPHAVGVRFMWRSEVRRLVASGQVEETRDSQEEAEDQERADKVVPVLFDTGKKVATVLTVRAWAERIAGINDVWRLKLIF